MVVSPNGVAGTGMFALGLGGVEGVVGSSDQEEKVGDEGGDAVDY